MPESTGGNAPADEMCPHCGDLFPVYDGLICKHGYLGEPCPGSEQIPRNAESDARRLWNGEPNRRFRG